MVLQRTGCASAVLNHFGVSGVTWNNRIQKNVWADTLRRNGFSVRSCKSVTKSSTVGGARKDLLNLANSDLTILGFVIRVKGHVLLLDRLGNTIVDTAPRKADRRKLQAVMAVRK